MESVKVRGIRGKAFKRGHEFHEFMSGLAGGTPPLLAPGLKPCIFSLMVYL
jgi:hypothetical protein